MRRTAHCQPLMIDAVQKLGCSVLYHCDKTDPVPQHGGSLLSPRNRSSYGKALSGLAKLHLPGSPHWLISTHHARVHRPTGENLCAILIRERVHEMTARVMHESVHAHPLLGYATRPIRLGKSALYSELLDQT